MNKYTFMGNGRNKNFYFTFPFFSRADIIVKINGEPATGYGVFCIPNSTGNDFPFTGGHIHFAQAPRATDTVTIERELQLNRLIDYQTTVQLNPSTINQDMNYFFELLKDMKCNLQNFAETYAEFTDTESAQNLLNRIDAVMDEINNIGDLTTINTNITNLGTAVSNLSESLNTISSTIDTHTTNIGVFDNFKNAVLDYVIESQLPTAENNYTWYRKYKSGWVEQGGYQDGSVSHTSNPIVFPKEMSDTKYSLIVQSETPEKYSCIQSKTKTGFCVKDRVHADIWYDSNFKGIWRVCGMAA